MFEAARDQVILLSTHHVDEVTCLGASVARIADRTLTLERGRAS
jgi:hypothetical protein